MASLFDKVVTELNKGVTSVSEGSKNIVERAKLNTQIAEFQKRKEKCLFDVGNIVYKLYAEGEIKIEQCESLFDEIASCESSIWNSQKQIQALETQKEQSAQSSANNVKMCSSCGAANKSTAKFCVCCGNSLS